MSKINAIRLGDLWSCQIHTRSMITSWNALIYLFITEKVFEIPIFYSDHNM